MQHADRRIIKPHTTLRVPAKGQLGFVNGEAGHHGRFSIFDFTLQKLEGSVGANRAGFHSLEVLRCAEDR